ncbi:MAG: hypothetical protein N2422_03635 [Rhodobacteraceae bacterium]|nr:hypothetical protein [Paracoccaceae bacterium]
MQIVPPAGTPKRRSGGRRILRKLALAALILGFMATAWAVYSEGTGLSIEVQALPAPG